MVLKTLNIPYNKIEENVIRQYDRCIMVLTGTGYLELLLQEEYKEGKTRDPIAVKIKLCEVLMGVKKGKQSA